MGEVVSFFRPQPRPPLLNTAERVRVERLLESWERWAVISAGRRLRGGLFFAEETRVYRRATDLLRMLEDRRRAWGRP